MNLTLLLDPLSGERPDRAQIRERLLAASGGLGHAPDCSNGAALDAAVQTIEASEETIVAVTGGDAGLSAVATALMARGWPDGARILPLGGDGESLVGGALGLSGKPEAILKRLVAARRGGFGLRRPKLRDAPLRSLQVICSSRARADYGFVFGAGAFFRLADRGRSAPSGRLGAVARGLLGALGTERAWERIEARVAVDQVPFAESLRAVAATTLARLPLGLRPFDGPTDSGQNFNFLWHDMNRAATAALMVPLSRGLLQSAQHKRARPHTVHIDMTEGFVLDGALHTAPGPQIIAIEPGPSIPLVAV